MGDMASKDTPTDGLETGCLTEHVQLCSMANGVYESARVFLKDQSSARVCINNTSTTSAKMCNLKSNTIH